jgi:hypothetical protein
VHGNIIQQLRNKMPFYIPRGTDVIASVNSEDSYGLRTVSGAVAIRQKISEYTKCHVDS